MENNTLVVGKEAFGPTSKGHESASNKRFRRLLSRYVPIVMGTEHKASKLSCCCQIEARKLTTQSYKKVLRCDTQQNPTVGRRCRNAGNFSGEMKMRRTISCPSSNSRMRTSKKQFQASFVRRPSCSRLKNLERLMCRQPRHVFV
jgi:hypothetical protein